MSYAIVKHRADKDRQISLTPLTLKAWQLGFFITSVSYTFSSGNHGSANVCAFVQIRTSPQNEGRSDSFASTRYRSQ